MKLSDETQRSIGPTVANALAEDVGDGDLTASLIDEDAVLGATIVARVNRSTFAPNRKQARIRCDSIGTRRSLSAPIPTRDFTSGPNACTAAMTAGIPGRPSVPICRAISTATNCP